MNFTIRKKVLVCSLLPLVLLGAIVILVAATMTEGCDHPTGRKFSARNSNSDTGQDMIKIPGSYLETKNGDVWKGSYNISQSDNLDRCDSRKKNPAWKLPSFMETSAL